MTVNTENPSVLFPRLSIFQSISNLSLLSVREKVNDGRLDEIVLEFGRVGLIITANEEEDSLEIRAVQDMDSPGFVDVSESDPWKTFVGKAFISGWLAISQLGHWDGLLLSFDAGKPQLMLHVLKSSIRVAVIG